MCKEGFCDQIAVGAERRPVALICFGCGSVAGLFSGVIGLFITGSFLSSIAIYLFVSVATALGILGFWLVRNSANANANCNVEGRKNPKSILEGIDEKSVSPDEPVGEILVVSNGLDDVSDALQSLLGTHHYKLVSASSVGSFSLHSVLTKRQYDYIFLDLEFLEDIGISVISVVDQLREFRRAAPGVALILLSTSFGRDSSELHRLEICDASIKLPVSQSRLMDAMQEACANNVVWCQRQISA